MSESDDASLLPPKRDVALALVQTASSVFIHLDPRGAEVIVPSWFKSQPELVLQIGLNLVPPIVDLDIGADALSATLSFNRRPEYCKIPWSAIWGLVGDDGRGMIWPESVPPEVAARAPGRASGGQQRAERTQRKGTAGHLRTAGSASPPKVTPPSTSERDDATAQTSDSSKENAAPRKRELPPYLRVVK